MASASAVSRTRRSNSSAVSHSITASATSPRSSWSESLASIGPELFGGPGTEPAPDHPVDQLALPLDRCSPLPLDALLQPLLVPLLAPLPGPLDQRHRSFLLSSPSQCSLELLTLRTVPQRQYPFDPRPEGGVQFRLPDRREPVRQRNDQRLQPLRRRSLLEPRDHGEHVVRRQRGRILRPNFDEKIPEPRTVSKRFAGHRAEQVADIGRPGPAPLSVVDDHGQHEGVLATRPDILHAEPHPDRGGVVHHAQGHAAVDGGLELQQDQDVDPATVGE